MHSREMRAAKESKGTRCRPRQRPAWGVTHHPCPHNALAGPNDTPPHTGPRNALGPNKKPLHTCLHNARAP